MDTAQTTLSATHRGADIDRLSDDVLTEILDHIHAAAANEPDTLAREWFPVLWVCQRWRRIALSRPKFWSVIPIDSNPERLSFFIAHCAGAPADIYVKATHSSRSSSHLAHLSLLHPVLSTLRVIDFDLRSAQDIMTHIDSFISFLSNDMPALEDLRIAAPHVSGHSPLDLRLHLARFPGLRHLTLSGVLVPQDISNLQSLLLQGCRWNVPFPQFLDALERCPDLQSIALRFSCWWDAADSALSSARPVIALRRLQQLDITGASLPIAAAIVAHLDAPSVKKTVVHSAVPGGAPAEVRGLFPGSPTVMRRVLPKLTAPAAITLSNANYDYSISCDTSEELIALSLHPEEEDDWFPALSSLLDDLVFLFAEEQHVPIELTVHGGFLDAVDASAWGNVFRTCERLARLELLDTEGSFDNMWLGLQSATSRLPAPQVCCPHLKTVRLAPQRASESEEIPESMVEAIRTRTERGSALEELSWDPRRRGAASADFGERVAAALAPLIPRIVIEGDYPEVIAGQQSAS